VRHSGGAASLRASRLARVPGVEQGQLAAWQCPNQVETPSVRVFYESDEIVRELLPTYRLPPLSYTREVVVRVERGIGPIQKRRVEHALFLVRVNELDMLKEEVEDHGELELIFEIQAREVR
jgi:hypothetical protein